MIIPGQQFQVDDPGLPAVIAGLTASVVLGVASGGVENVVYSFTNPRDVVDTIGQGGLPEALCTSLEIGGGPQYGVRLHASIAGTIGTITKTGSGSGTVTPSGAPFDAYKLRVLITKDGAPGTAEFSFSLDGLTWSDNLVTPSGGTPAGSFFGIEALTGIKLVFAGTFATGDLYSWDCSAPFYSPSDLANGMAAILDSGIDFAFIHLAGEAATTSAGKLLAAALDVHVKTLFNQARFVRAMLGSGRSDKATAVTDYQSFSSRNVLVTYGQCVMLSSKPMAGWSYPTRSIINTVAARACGSLISTDLGRVKSGALEGVVAIAHDEARYPQMDAKGFTTLRTVQGRAGFYITNGRLMSPPGSDFRYWQHARCMDTACRIAWIEQSANTGASMRVIGNGAIDPRDAARWEAPVRTSLNEGLISPQSAEGTPGHVSAVKYDIDRSYNALSNEGYQSDVGIKPRGYAKFIYTRLSFTTNVGA